jgi:hypothetical protein
MNASDRLTVQFCVENGSVRDLCAALFTRLTNDLSKRVENLEAAVALHYMHYNFCRIHQTLGVTPAMEAGVPDHVWSLDELIALLA